MNCSSPLGTILAVCVLVVTFIIFWDEVRSEARFHALESREFQILREDSEDENEAQS